MWLTEPTENLSTTKYFLLLKNHWLTCIGFLSKPVCSHLYTVGWSVARFLASPLIFTVIFCNFQVYSQVDITICLIICCNKNKIFHGLCYPQKKTQCVDYFEQKFPKYTNTMYTTMCIACTTFYRRVAWQQCC